MKAVDPVPCQHIADYYSHKQREQPCIGYGMLYRGYKEHAAGLIEGYAANNLYRQTIRMNRQ